MYETKPLWLERFERLVLDTFHDIRTAYETKPPKQRLYARFSDDGTPDTY